MYNSNVKSAIVKTIGLLGDFPKNDRLEFQADLLRNGFVEDFAPLSISNYTDLTSDKRKIHLKDVFYPDFRDLMFIKPENSYNERESLSTRFSKEFTNELYFVRVDQVTGIVQQSLKFKVVKCEIFLFAEQIGLFSLTLELNKSLLNDFTLNDLIFFCRNFDSLVSFNGDGDTMVWHNYITSNFICKRKLVGNNVKADEYSGSKFKVFTAIDCNVSAINRLPYLYDMGTSSKLGSAKGNHYISPHPEYYDELMKNKISIFNNWEALCLFDSFTCVGNGLLVGRDEKDTLFKTNNWEYIYFRIYLSRVFFKYNLYRYNTNLHENTFKLRNQFEGFLNNYNLSHISFNFLPNVIFDKIGAALHLDEELERFQKRINRISSAIQEKKQSKTNMLLQIVTVLGGISSVQPVVGLLNRLKTNLGWTSLSFFSVIISIVVFIGLGVLNWLKPEFFKKLGKSVKKLWK